MSRKLNILFHPIEGVGHVNACIGLAQALHARGHRIVFVTTKTWQGKFMPYGFEEEYLVEENSEIEKRKKSDFKPGEELADQLLSQGFLEPMSPIEKLKVDMKSNFMDEVIEKVKIFEPQLKTILAKTNPDVIVLDHFTAPPSLIYSGKPWVWLFSANPLCVIDDDRAPPGRSGLLSTTDKNSEECKKFRELTYTMMDPHLPGYNKWLEEKVYPPLTGRLLNVLTPHSPYLNIYQFPEELDYTELRPIPDKWLRVDSFIRHRDEEFELPEKLKNRDQNEEKLIFLSLGSMGSVNVPLMERLINILSKSQHKFIVSKGIFGHKYELADNMWGENSVTQTKVLPLVDLVITHGGNNTVTEAFNFGKPMIVMPLFGDQFDNAQRIHGKGYGLRMDAHICTEEELLSGIEKLLNDKEMYKRLESAAKRIKECNSISNVAEDIEKLGK